MPDTMNVLKGIRKLGWCRDPDVFRIIAGPSVPGPLDEPAEKARLRSAAAVWFSAVYVDGSWRLTGQGPPGTGQMRDSGRLLHRAWQERGCEGNVCLAHVKGQGELSLSLLHLCGKWASIARSQTLPKAFLQSLLKACKSQACKCWH